MAEVAIKEHTRRGKGGKTVHVRGYTRRVGHKGVRSPKRERKQEGKEFEEKVEEKKQEQVQEKPKMTPEEFKKKLQERREWEENARRAEEERKSLGMSKERYSYYKVHQQKNAERNKTTKVRPDASSHSTTVHQPLSPEGTKAILERVEDKIASFIEKYSNKKYRKYL